MDGETNNNNILIETELILFAILHSQNGNAHLMNSAQMYLYTHWSSKKGEIKK